MRHHAMLFMQTRTAAGDAVRRPFFPLSSASVPFSLPLPFLPRPSCSLPSPLPRPLYFPLLPSVPFTPSLLYPPPLARCPLSLSHDAHLGHFPGVTLYTTDSNILIEILLSNPDALNAAWRVGMDSREERACGRPRAPGGLTYAWRTGGSS